MRQWFVGLSVLALGGSGCLEDVPLVPSDDFQGTPAAQRISVENDPAALAGRVEYASESIDVVPLSAMTPQALGEDEVSLTLVARVAPPTATGYDRDGEPMGEYQLQATSVEISGTTAIVSYHQIGEPHAAVVDVFDVSDPSHPVLRSSATFAQMDLNAVTFAASGNGSGQLYLAGSTVDPEYPYGALVERMSLADYALSVDANHRFALRGDVGTSVAMGDGAFFATSARDGELVAYDGAGAARTGQVELADARWVAVDGGRVVVVNGSVLSVYDSQLNAVGNLTFDSGLLPTSKSTVDLAGGKAFIAAGTTGLQVISTQTGARVGGAALPQDTGYDPSEVATNAVSADGRVVFTANGALGVHLALTDAAVESSSSEADIGLETLGALDLDGSANHVAYDNGLLFVAEGTRGLSIIRVTGLDLGGSVTSSLAAGNTQTCAIGESGQVRCWGANYRGQLGTGNTAHIGDNELPSQGADAMAGAHKVVAGAEHTCALDDAGDVYCWGANYYGQTGQYNPYSYYYYYYDNYQTTPRRVQLPGKAVDLAAGGYHTCALLDTGDVQCWGYNVYGQLGRGYTSSYYYDYYGYYRYDQTWQPAAVRLGARATSLAAGVHHTCAVLESGKARCWGYGYYGSLGTNDGGVVSDPSRQADVQLDGSIVSMAAGAYHTCALMDTGSLRCFGYNYQGQLGYGHTSSVVYAANAGDVPLPGEVVSVSAGNVSHHTCAVLSSGSLHCWGYNGYGQTGQAVAYSQPSAANGRVDIGAVTEVATGGHHTCARTAADGAARCWGANWYGQLGYGNTTTQSQASAAGPISIW